MDFLFEFGKPLGGCVIEVRYVVEHTTFERGVIDFVVNSDLGR